MDYKKFIEQLPDLYENWGEKSVTPKSSRFGQVLDRVKGMRTANVLQLLNWAVGCMEQGEVYCEVGCFQGASLIGALLDRPEQMAYAVDNCGELDAAEENLTILTDNLSRFNISEQVLLADQDFEEFFGELRSLETTDKIGVYFYDGGRDYRSHLMGLLLVKPFLADRSLMILSGSHVDLVQQANWDFVAANPECQVLLDLTKTPEGGLSWNGLQVLCWDVEQENNGKIDQVRNPLVIKSISQLQTEEHKKKIESLHTEALSLHHGNNYAIAVQKYKEVLHWDPDNAKVCHNLGLAYYNQEKYREALEWVIQSLKLDQSIGLHYYSLGLVLEQLDKKVEAIAAYQKSIELNPQLVDAYNNLGNIRATAGEREEAESIYRQAIAANPDHFGSYLNLGNVLMAQDRVDEAIEAYRKSMKLKPGHPDILHNIGIAFEAKNEPAKLALCLGYAAYQQGKYEEAIEQFQKFQATQTGKVDFYLALGKCYRERNQYESAIATYRKGISLYPQEENIYFQLLLSLQSAGRIEAAMNVADEGCREIAGSQLLKLEKQKLLPIIYETPSEIDLYRNRFSRGVREFIQSSSLATPESRKQAMIATGMTTNFYLQYQGKNDLELQIQYGEFVRQVMAANYPQWIEPRAMPPLKQDGKIRIGYISECLRAHTVGKLSLGWLRNSNRQQFEVYCYHIDRSIDFFTQKFRLYSNVFHHIPENLEATCKQIISDKLHVLVFIDIGMHPTLTQIAALRLTPVQCTTWGHPITSGLATIDYFLSSDLMEPENAEAHYCEKLIRLPNIGFSYGKPIIPEIKETRADFQLRDDAVVYLSCQSLYKYLPQYDYIFATIAQRVPLAQIAFISHLSDAITQKFQQRLKRAFANVGLNSEDYCLFLPRQGQNSYLALNCVSDIFLDTFCWSGGNTTLEAIASGLPVVTCPGEFMRGRHSYGILRMLGVTDTIARDEAEYIEIAVRLGLDGQWRESIVRRMSDRHDYLYDDLTCVTALEEFYRRVVSESLSNTS